MVMLSWIEDLALHFMKNLNPSNVMVDVLSRGISEIIFEDKLCQKLGLESL